MPLTISIAAAVALAAGAFGLAKAWRRHLAEMAITAAALIAVGILILSRAVLSLTSAADVGVGDTAWLLAAFLGSLIASPLLLSGLGLARAVARSWRSWSAGAVALATLAGAALMAADDQGLRSDPSEASAVALSTFAAVVFACLAWRHHRLFRVGGRAGSLIAAIGLAALAIGSMAGGLAAASPVATSLAETAVLFGLVVATCGVGLALGGDCSVAPTLAPLVDREPLIGLELQLTPIVRRYVAALERKDPLTRDHGLRVGELAMRTGKRAGLGSDRLQALGLAALLHDAGKLFTPTDILLKPAALTPDEYDAVKQHPVWGAELLASSPVLAPAADLVRWHHERVDGSGYPDGLRGTEIPLEAAMISVCDAWDAMTFSLLYRSAMSPERARWILLGGSGTQWSPRAVDLLLEELAANGPVDHSVYDAVGLNLLDLAAQLGVGPADVDDDAIPEEARAHLK